MTLLQKVPTTGVGTMVQWIEAVVDEAPVCRRVRLASRRRRQPRSRRLGRASRGTDGDDCSATPAARRTVGGVLRAGQSWLRSNLSVTRERRVWTTGSNYDAHNLETTVATGLPTPRTSGRLPDDDDTVFSPRVAALYKRHRPRVARGAASASASARRR